MREKIQTSRERRVINPATIAKTPATPAIPYPNKTAATYLNKTATTYPNKTATTYLNKTAATYPNDVAITYPNETANLSKLKNQRGVRLLHPEISKRLNGIIKETVDQPIHSGANRKPQVKVKG